MAVLFLIAVMAAVVGAVYSVTGTEGRFMERSTDRATAIAYGDGVIQSLFDQWRLAAASATDPYQRGLSTSSANYDGTGGFTYDELMNGVVTSPATSLPKNSAGTALLPLKAPTSSQLPVPPGISLASWNVAPADPYLNPVGSATAKTTRPKEENGTNSQSLRRVYYLATVTVNYRHGGTVIVQRPFVRAGRNMFDNFLFSTQPITEINPGAAMYVNGNVYVGGDLYTGTSNLNFLQDVTFTGNWTIGYAPGDPHASTPSSPTWPTGNVPHSGAQQKLLDAPMSALDPNYLDRSNTNDSDSDKNLDNDGYHEILEMKDASGKSTGDDPLQIDSATSERLANNADYQITVDINNAIKVFKGTQDATTGAISYTEITSGADYNAITGAMVTNTTLFDGREGDNVRTVNLDVKAIATGANAGNITDNVGKGDGLLIYIQDTSNGKQANTGGYTTATTTTVNGNTTTTSTNYTNYSVGAGTGSSKTATVPTSSDPKVKNTALSSSTRRGIRLVNGGVLPNMGLTVATPNPVYIQGDYNSGATTNYSSSTATAAALTNSGLPPSDASGAYPSGTSSPTEYSTGYDKKAAAVVADSVTVLSNSWSDTNSLNGLGSRVPTNTTINAAIVAGNVPTPPPDPTTGLPIAGANYSGGVENFPRLLETWSGSLYLTIHGSFGLLYDSEQATGPWKQTGNYYNAPSRRWFYDSILQDKNPPGFPVAYSYGMGAWTLRNSLK